MFKNMVLKPCLKKQCLPKTMFSAIGCAISKPCLKQCCKTMFNTPQPPLESHYIPLNPIGFHWILLDSTTSTAEPGSMPQGNTGEQPCLKTMFKW